MRYDLVVMKGELDISAMVAQDNQNARDVECCSHYISYGITGHGECKGKDEHVDQSDEGDGRSDGLVVGSKVEQGVGYAVGDGRRCLGDCRHGGRVVTILRHTAGQPQLSR